MSVLGSNVIEISVMNSVVKLSVFNMLGIVMFVVSSLVMIVIIVIVMMVLMMLLVVMICDCVLGGL